MPRKLFEQSEETRRLLALFESMKMDEKMSFADASKAVKFPVGSTTAAYHAARRIAERDAGIYIGAIRKFGFFRGTGEDMVHSLAPLASRMKRIAKKSIDRADIAIEQNLPEELHSLAVERRSRASIIHSTSAAPMPKSNRRQVAAPQPAPPFNNFAALQKAPE